VARGVMVALLVSGPLVVTRVVVAVVVTCDVATEKTK